MTTDHDAENAEFLTLLHAAMRTVRREAGSGWGGRRPRRDSSACCGRSRAATVRSAGRARRHPRRGPRSVTSKVDDAEAAGLVRRRPDPTDRRATLVELTEAGQQTLARVAAERETSAGTLLSRLDDADRHELLRLLRAVAAGSDDAPGRAAGHDWQDGPMFRVGLTGGIAAGKSVALDRFAELGRASSTPTSWRATPSHPDGRARGGGRCVRRRRAGPGRHARPRSARHHRVR
ncbi:hypothetical protein NKG05_28900 [Oerskovia sp. M15]